MGAVPNEYDNSSGFKVLELRIYHQSTQCCTELIVEARVCQPVNTTQHQEKRLGFRAPTSQKSQHPRDLRTHKLKLLGPKTILYWAFGLF